jgi:hypothetical protein
MAAIDTRLLGERPTFKPLNMPMRNLFLICMLFQAPLAAQTNLEIPLPNITIIADKILQGDGDTYGLGTWDLKVKVWLEGYVLHMEGQIVFSENANDFTVIAGSFEQQIIVEDLKKCQHCLLKLNDPEGRVSGPNVGARGYRWYSGQGLVRRARIVTDTFGADNGHVGGTIEWMPLKVLIHCLYAAE